MSDVEKRPADASLDARYCTVCGQRAEPGVRYCTRCGAELPELEVEDEKDESAGAADDEGSSTVSDEKADEKGSESAEGRRRSGRSVIALAAGIAGGCVLGAAISASLFWWLSASDGPQVQEMSYGADETVSVLRDDRIIPQATDGEALTSYTVFIEQGTGTDGNRVDVDDACALKVGDDQGFTPDDALDGLEDGTYTFRIESDEGTCELPPVQVDTGSSDTVFNVVFGQDSPDPEPIKKGADACYLEKLKELTEAHGMPKYGNLTLEDGYRSFISGLCYAGLIDFGNGEECLVVTYCTKQDLSTPPVFSDYNVEVWQYNEDSDALDCVYGADASAHASGMDILPNVQVAFDSYLDDQTILWFYWFHSDTNSFVNHYVGVKPDGSVGLIHETSNSTTQEGTKYYLDGKEVSLEEQNQATSEDCYVHDGVYPSWGYNLVYNIEEDQQLFDGNDTGSSYGAPIEAGATVIETMDTLEHRAGNVRYLRGARDGVE